MGNPRNKCDADMRFLLLSSKTDTLGCWAWQDSPKSAFTHKQTVTVQCANTDTSVFCLTSPSHRYMLIQDLMNWDRNDKRKLQDAPKNICWGRSAAKTSFSGNNWERRYGTFIAAAILMKSVAQAQLLAMIPSQVLFQDAAVAHVGSLPGLYQMEQNHNNYNRYSSVYLSGLCHGCEKGPLATARSTKSLKVRIFTCQDLSKQNLQLICTFVFFIHV